MGQANSNQTKSKPKKPSLPKEVIIEMNQKRALIIKELLSTEITYVNGLQQLVHVRNFGFFALIFVF
jgi:hypothetical protein